MGVDMQIQLQYAIFFFLHIYVQNSQLLEGSL